MWLHRSLALLLLGLLHAVGGSRQATTPVQKVINLLTKLREKLTEEGKAEAVAWEKYSTFCRHQISDKKYAIDKSDTKINELSASIDALGADITELDGDVGKLNTDMETEKGETKTNKETRDGERDTFVEEEKKLKKAVKAIGEAMEALKKSKDKVRGSSMLAKLPPQVSALVEAAVGAPGDAAGYKFQSHDVIAVLQNLQRTFNEKLTELQEVEAKAQHAYDMTEGARANKIAAMQAEVDEKQKISAFKSEEKSKKEGVMAEEEKDRDADKDFLAEVESVCEAKTTAWDERSKAREDEIKAITEGLQHLSGMGETYKANSKLVGMLQGARNATARNASGAAPRNVSVAPHKPRGTVSLLQLNEEPRSHGRVEAALDFLAKKGKAMASTAFLAIASQSFSGADPFVKVRSIVKDLITRLEKEAADEADAKSVCDTSMKEAIEKRDEYQAEVETISATIDKTKSEIKTLLAEVEELGQRIAEIHKDKNELQELREEEKARNNRTIFDADAGAEAVNQAITVLKAFYEPELVQRSAKAQRYVPPGADRDGNTVSDLAPETFEGEYRGGKAESKGIIGLLEVISADFERTSTTTTEAEAQAVSDFEEQEGKLDDEIKNKETLKDEKSGDAETKEGDLVTSEDDLKTQKDLLETALKELDVLKTTCVDTGESQEERKKRREEEIEALKSAMDILENWNS